MASGWERLRCGIEDQDRRAPPSNVIRGRSADNRKAPLNFSFPLEGKCHVVAKGCTRVSIPMKLTIVLLGPTSADLETLCRVSTKRRISVRMISSEMPINTSQRGGAVAGNGTGGEGVVTSFRSEWRNLPIE